MKRMLLIILLIVLCMQQSVVAANSVGEQELFSDAMQAVLSIGAVQGLLDWMGDAIAGKPKKTATKQQAKTSAARLQNKQNGKEPATSAAHLQNNQKGKESVVEKKHTQHIGDANEFPSFSEDSWDI